MPSPEELQLIYVFAGLLAFGSVFLLGFPLLRHAWMFAVSRTAFAVVVGGMLVLGLGAVALVFLAIGNPLYFLPVAIVTFSMRVVSPVLLWRRVRDALETRRGWTAMRWVLLVSFLVLAGVLVFDILAVAAGSGAPLPAVLSEQLIMALGASVLIVRLGLRARPQERAHLWPVWLAAVLFAMAFIIVAPYAFPAFAILYAVSGLAGWLIGAFAVWYDW